MPPDGKCSARGVSVWVGVSAYVATECVAVAAHAIQNSFFFRSGVAVYVVLTFAYVNVSLR